jgi:minor curlin subunit
MPGFFKKAHIGAVAGLLLAAAAPRPAGAEDAADIQQIDPALGGVANIAQQGTENSAEVKQRAVASGQVDFQNHAVISQSGEGNSALIAQDGSTNSAEIAQNGSNNQGAILQQHSGNSAELQQSGNGLAITIEQFGAGTPGSAPIQVIQTN